MGLLISIEGGEYAGKTSLIAPALKKIIKNLGIETKISREPGGTPRGESMRKEIFEKAEEGAGAYDFAVLFNQARKIHIDELIIPFLGETRQNTAVLLLDRYLDSTRAYQGLEGGVDLSEIKKLEEEYVGNVLPDLTLILYFPDHVFKQIYFARKYGIHTGRETTPWDDSHLETHIKRQEYYLKLPALAKQWGEDRDFAVVDASRAPAEVVKDCVAACMPHLLRLDPRLSEEKIAQVFTELEKEEYFEKLVRNL